MQAGAKPLQDGEWPASTARMEAESGVGGGGSGSTLRRAVGVQYVNFRDTPIFNVG